MIYRWIDKYDGTIASLTNKSRRPYTSPNAHTESEIKLIRIIREIIKTRD